MLATVPPVGGCAACVASGAETAREVDKDGWAPAAEGQVPALAPNPSQALGMFVGIAAAIRVQAPPWETSATARRSLGALRAVAQHQLRRFRPGRTPNADYREGAGMPTLQCESCGAQYYSAATDELLDLVVALFDCEQCVERGPMRVTDAGVGFLAEEPKQQAS